MKLTIRDCLDAVDIRQSAISIITKVSFNPRKGYSTSHDGLAYWDIFRNSNYVVNKIIKSINNQTFHFSPCKKITKKMRAGKTRDLYISTWTDKIVEKWLNDSLNALLNKWFSKNSYAYRVEEFGIDSCQKTIGRHMKIGNTVAKRDISKYFYSINHEILISKIKELVDENDYLFQLLLERIQFWYVDASGTPQGAIVGVPFGASIACTFSNIYLTHLDKLMLKHHVVYCRYADDFLLVGKKLNVQEAVKELDEELARLNLKSNPKHEKIIDIDGINRIKHLGIEYNGTAVRLPVEKQRKIINLFKDVLERERATIKKIKDHDERLKFIVQAMNAIVIDRIKGIAIIDYYLKHINDEHQLKILDRQIIELAIAWCLDKPFRKKDFSTIPPSKLRSLGLISLVHRKRLHEHGHIKIDFIKLCAEVTIERYENMHKSRKERIQHMRMAKIISKQALTSG